MKKQISPAIGALAALGVAASPAIADRPNIVLIYADDIGYGDLSCYGSKTITTPNVDRLAREGLRFTSAYSPSATCTPSRYAMLTGQYAFRQPGTSILNGDAGLIIAPGRQTLASMLKDAGYNTAIVGKWHLGLGDENGPQWNGELAPGPNQVGFDYSFIFPATADRVPSVFVENGRVVNLDPADPIRVDYRNPIDDGPTGEKNPELVRMKSDGPQHNNTIVNGIPRIGYMSGGKAALWKDEDLASSFTSHAQRWLEKQPKDQPFFLFLPTHDNHVPRAPDPRFVGTTPHGPRGDSVVEFDWMAGEIMKTLDKLELSENTMVILSSDNGPVVNDGYFDDAERLIGDHKPAGPFRGGKYSFYEGGSRLPFIVRWPARVKPGVSDAMLSQMDLLASLAELTGQPVNRQSATDSQNVLPALLGQSKVGRSELVEHARAQQVALRSGNWKFIPSKLPQLYDLSKDAGETKNIAAEHPAKVAELDGRLKELHAHPAR